VAASVEVDATGTCRAAELTCAGVGDRPIRLTGATECLVGQHLSEELLTEACELAATSIEPSSDLMASADYKLRLVKVLAARALKAAHARATSEPL